MKTQLAGSNAVARIVPARGERGGGWQRWAPYATLVWSLAYGLLGVFWLAGGQGFPYGSEDSSNLLGPLLGRFGPSAAWTVVILAGLPAAAMGAAMLRGTRGKVIRPLLIAGGMLLAGVLLLLMTSLDLLVLVGYIPYTLRGLIIGDGISRQFLAGWTAWTTIHQILCLLGGFLWLGATVVYTRRSVDACPVCGRGEGAEGWTSPERAARWGRIAIWVGMIAPVFYAFTRYAWALGWPLGMTEEYWRQGYERGLWISGLFLATFGLVGALLMLGLEQRWGEVFPRWMIGLRGRRVPIALAVVPAALVSVLLVVGGIVIGSGVPQMAANLAASGATKSELFGGIVFQLGPTLLFPLWGVALAIAALGYYFRRRGPCQVCGRGTIHEAEERSSALSSTVVSIAKG